MSVAAARSILRSTASRAASSPARLSGAAKASRSPFRISNQNSLAHRIFRYLSHSHTNTESVVDACGDELLCQIFVAISHSNGFCIAHFNALRLSRLDPRRWLTFIFGMQCMARSIDFLDFIDCECEKLC